MIPSLVCPQRSTALQEAAMHRPTFAMLAELERTQWLSRRQSRLIRRNA